MIKSQVCKMSTNIPVKSYASALNENIFNITKYINSINTNVNTLQVNDNSILFENLSNFKKCHLMST